jgi:exopolyphosphatase/pppGpp-phosphohydrolase
MNYLVLVSMMRIFEIHEIQVPNVGLKNGLFWDAVDRRRTAKTGKGRARLS